MKNMSELGKSYIGPNKSHQSFKENIIYLKHFIFIFNQGKDKLFEDFKTYVLNLKKKGGEYFSFGVVTKVISQTQFEGLTIPFNESKFFLNNYDKFIENIYKKDYIDLFTIFIAFLINLYGEILLVKNEFLKGRDKSVSFKEIIEGENKDQIIEIMIEKELNELGYANFYEFNKTFENINLPIIDRGFDEKQKEDFTNKFKEVWATRNILVHNDGIVNDTFLNMVNNSSFKRGDKININIEVLGRTIALVQYLADNINKRAEKKIFRKKRGNN